MTRIHLTSCVAALIAASGAYAQTAAPTSPSSTQPAPPAQAQPPRAQQDRASHPAQSATVTRPNASYAHPSGQDSHPDKAPRTTKLAAVGSKQDRESGRDRKPQTSRNSKQEEQLGRQKTYTESSGAKSDPGTACSTARPSKDGGVDCGMSGNSATNGGHIVNKPH